MAFWNASNSAVHAQPARPEPAVEDTVLETLQNKILVWNTDTSVARRRVANHRFVQDLGRLIRSDVAWDFPWSELHPVSALNSPDGQWKILTWSVQLEQNARRHYGCLFDQEGRLYPLLDQQANRFEIDTIYEGQQWPGAVYIEILPYKTLTRLQLIYPRDVRVQMNWDQEQGLIFFDHLISRGLDPSSADFDYIPDGTFDGLVWEKGALVFKEIPNYQPSR